MRRIKSVPVLFLLVLTCVLGISGEPGEGEIVLEEKIRSEETIHVETPPGVFKKEPKFYTIPPELVPYVNGPRVAFGKSVMWVVNHLVKHNGWGFLGWTKTGLDEDFHPWRLHVGIIGGEFDAGKAYNLLDESDRTSSYQMLDQWERERTHGIVFGIVFTKTF